MRTTRLPSPNRAGRAGPVALLMALAVLATGCFRVDVRTEVNEDGSGTVETLSAIDADSVLELLAPFGEEFTGGEELTRESICEESLAETDVPEGATVEPYDEDGFCGLRVTADFGPGEDPAATIGELFGDDAGEGEFVLEREGDGWRFEATIEANEEEISAKWKEIAEICESKEDDADGWREIYIGVGAALLVGGLIVGAGATALTMWAIPSGNG